MRDRNRLSRRTFLTDLGKGTFGVAILGLSACSSDQSTTSGPATNGSSPTTGDGPTTSTPSTSTSGNSSEGVEGSASSADSAPLQWERVNLGFVSAYVLARGSEMAIVDTGSGGSEKEILSAITLLGGSWDSVRHVIVTHSHGDHIGSLRAVLDMAPFAAGYAGTADLDKISAPEALIGLNDGDEVFGLQVLGTPGHTPGHISVFDADAQLVIAGDALNAPGGDVTGPNPQFTPDMGLANASVKHIAERDFETLLVGHGEPVLAGAGSAVKSLAAEL